jgi:PAS domain S-box-containing protein
MESGVADKKMADNEKVNILMVDDQLAKLLSYEVILAELGANLIKATSGREALDHLLKTDIAVVLMDVSMPEIDGFELADMIRQHPRFQKTAIIFISGVHLSDADRIQGYRRGAVDYISVPVVPEVLRAKVGVFVELHRKTRQLEKLNRQLEERVEERTEEIRQLNTQLEQRVTELETIMEVLPVGVAMAQDPNCNQIVGNLALTKLFEVNPGENVNAEKANLEVYREGKKLSIQELPLQRAASSGEAIGSSELLIHLPSGKNLGMLASASPLFDEHGAVRGAVGAFIDVTERKQMEDTLRERAELLELATEAIMVRDLSGAVLYWNSGAEQLYGWRRGEIIGKKVHHALKTIFPMPYKEIEAELIASGFWEGNLLQQTSDGAKITVASRKAFIKDRQVVLEINRDMTSRLLAEEALRQTEKLAAMGRVAGIIAHEINNPLEAITNAFFLLRDHASLDEEARYYASLAEQELVRVSHITRQTLSFYREAKQPVTLSVSALLDDVLELQARRMQMARIEVQKRYATPGQLQGFPVELKQVFLNLIGNAIQAMPDGGKLRVSVRETGRYNGSTPGISVSILDTGAGIKSEDAKHLFEPFFSTKSEKGTGLGLWISRGIVQKYEGNITFRSVRSGEDSATCFRVFIPLRSESHLRSMIPAEAETNSAGVNSGGVNSKVAQGGRD